MIRQTYAESYKTLSQKRINLVICTYFPTLSPCSRPPGETLPSRFAGVWVMRKAQIESPAPIEASASKRSGGFCLGAQSEPHQREADDGA